MDDELYSDHFLSCTNENPAACPVIDEMLTHRIDQALSTRVG